jgi:hypothetical protein
VPPVGGDHLRVEISDPRRATELGGEPGREAAVDRPVLTPSPGGRRAGRDPIGLAREVAFGDRRTARRRHLGLPHAGRHFGRDQVHVVDADVDEFDLGELSLRVGH